ncbi:MAG TPA: hypothetical protein VG433_14820, partial [Pirellulales bacterium]|nr:hypothetical protein [Pirellulales bacterium]
MAEKKKMSVAEILAAARKADSKTGDAPASEPAPPAAEAEAAPAETAEAAAAPEPAAAKSAPTKPAQPVAKPGAAGRPSVSDILAAARAAKAGGEAAPAAKKPAPAAKAPAAKAAAAASAEKPAPKVKPAEKATVTTAEKDTASILAGAPKGAKPGPMSKAEAAKLNPDAPARPAPQPKNRLVVPPMPTKPEYAKPKAPKEAAIEE